MYKKSILILQDVRFRQYVRVYLNNRKIEVETAPLLFDTERIRRDLLARGNTSNIRAAFVKFIKDNGFPRLLMLDYTADFGLTPREDPDHRKLLRTIVIAYVILANAKGFDSALANLIFVAGRKEEPAIQSFINDPAVLIRQFMTQDERINSLINSFSRDHERLRNYLHLSCILRPSESSYTEEMDKLEGCADQIESIIAERKKKIETEKNGAPSTEMIITDFDPADVFCRATVDRILVNGKIRDITDKEKKNYQEKCIMLEGALTSKTITTVKDRIEATFKAMTRLNPFKKNDRIHIRIPDSSIIDGSFASAMGTFLSNSLSDYTGVSLDLGSENNKKLKDSKAYFAIKDFVLKNI